MKRSRVGCGGNELRPENGSGELDIRGIVSVLGLVLVVLQRAVMVIVPMLDGRLMEGGLLQGSVHPTEPSQSRNGLGENKEQG